MVTPLPASSCGSQNYSNQNNTQNVSRKIVNVVHQELENEINSKASSEQTMKDQN